MDPWGAGQAELTAAARPPAVAPMQIGLETPFAPDNHLQSVVWADIAGRENLPLTRAAAMSVPALARQRHLICGLTARCPLVSLTGAVRDPDDAQPYWLRRGDQPLSPYHRMLWSVDDLLWHGWTLWAVQRGAGDQIMVGNRVPWDLWEVDGLTGAIKVGGEVVDARSVILIPGPHEGILNFGAGAIRRMIDNLDAAANAARNPSAYLELHYDGDTPLTNEQIDNLIARWAQARRGENGGVSFTGKNVTATEHGTHEAHLLIEGRNADAVDASRLVSSPAAMTDATSSGASLTYETTEGRNVQLIEQGVGIYMDAIAARLSMDDVIPRTRRIAFDVNELTTKAPTPTGAPTLD